MSRNGSAAGVARKGASPCEGKCPSLHVVHQPKHNAEAQKNNALEEVVWGGVCREERETNGEKRMLASKTQGGKRERHE